MSQCDAAFDLKRHSDLFYHGPVISSPEQRSKRAIVLPPALALASASTNIKVLHSSF